MNVSPVTSAAQWYTCLNQGWKKRTAHEYILEWLTVMSHCLERSFTNIQSLGEEHERQILVLKSETRCLS